MRRLWLGGIACVMLVGACAKFSAEDPPADAAAPVPDGSTSDAEGGKVDGPPSGPTLGCPETLLSDDFDDPQSAVWRPEWSTVPTPLPNGYLSINASGGVNGGALQVDIAPPTNNTPREVTLLYPAPTNAKRYCLSIRMRVDAAGGGEVNFFGVEPVDRSVNGQSIVLVHQVNKTFAFEYRDANGNQAAKGFSLPLATWFLVNIEIDLVSHKLSAVADTQPLEIAIDPTWPSQPSSFKLGAPFIGPNDLAPQTAWKVRFDEVRLGVAR